ncbi:MAG: hypothetical protein AAF368_17430, partial [Planctomycetota bacterium]
PEAHPCAGVWRPIDERIASGFRLDRGSRARFGKQLAGFTGATVRAASIPHDPAAFEAILDALVSSDVPLRIDLPPAPAGALPEGLGRALEYDPDLLLVESSETDTLEAIDERLAEAEVGLVLSVAPGADGQPSGALLEWALGSRSCVAIRMELFEEGAVSAADAIISDRSGASPLAFFAPTWEFATALRHGITALDGDFGLLTSHQAAGLVHLAHESLSEALELERRLLRAVEGEVARTLRRAAPGEREQALRRVFEEFEARSGVPTHGTTEVEGLPPGLLAALASIGLPVP